MFEIWKDKDYLISIYDIKNTKICVSNMSNTCKQILEIQQSYISEKDIIDKFNYYNKYDTEIIWLINCNTGIISEQLSTGNYLIIFIDDWKYKSFNKIYEYILIDIHGKIFKIELKKIKSGMIEVKEYKTLDETIKFLQLKSNNIWNFWEDDNTVKSVLSVHQQGAGQGAERTLCAGR